MSHIVSLTLTPPAKWTAWSICCWHCTEVQTHAAAADNRPLGTNQAYFIQSTVRRAVGNMSLYVQGSQVDGTSHWPTAGWLVECLWQFEYLMKWLAVCRWTIGCLGDWFDMSELLTGWLTARLTDWLEYWKWLAIWMASWLAELNERQIDRLIAEEIWRWSRWPRGLRRRCHCDAGFESRRRHGWLSLVSVVCYVEISAKGRSLVQRSPTGRVSVCVCVTESDQVQQ
jgi:hypothetical protein